MGTSEDVFDLLAIRGPTRGEGMPGIEPVSSDQKSSPLPPRQRGGRYPMNGKVLCYTVHMIHIIALGNFAIVFWIIKVVKIKWGAVSKTPQDGTFSRFVASVC